jgi:hypothetical protein
VLASNVHKTSTMAVSPLLGYNTNVRHHGKLFHIQTEDSGATHGHIFTHLFADGGRIIASKKTTYKHYVGTGRYPEIVKKLMRESHKAMFIALRDGLFDGDEAAGARAIADIAIMVEDEAPATPPTEVDVEALERAAAARLAESEAKHKAATPETKSSPPSPGRYGPTRPAAPTASTRPRRSSKPAPARPDPSSESIFGGDLLSEKSLDEVILSYLAEDVEEES